MKYVLFFSVVLFASSNSFARTIVECDFSKSRPAQSTSHKEIDKIKIISSDIGATQFRKGALEITFHGRGQVETLEPIAKSEGRFNEVQYTNSTGDVGNTNLHFVSPSLGEIYIRSNCATENGTQILRCIEQGTRKIMPRSLVSINVADKIYEFKTNVFNRVYDFNVCARYEEIN